MTNQILNFTFAIYCVGALHVWTPTTSPSRIHKPPMAICVQTPTPLCFFHLPSNQTWAPFLLRHLSTSKICCFPTCWRITKFSKCSIAGRRPVSRYWRLKSTSANFMVIIRDWRKRCSSYGENFKFCKQASGEYQVLESYFSLKILHRFGPRIISETRSNSVSPSNLVSQVGSGSISHYSHKILWTLKDCQKDSHNIVTESNKSHLAMEKAVQHKDGTLINAGEWRAIKANVRVIASCDLLPLPIPCNTPISMKKKTKTYFTRYYLKQWNNAVLKLKEQEPLLALCAAHWKAKHVLNTILTGTSESNQKASTRRDDASDLEDPAIPLPTLPSKTNTSSSKRCLSNPSPSKPKKKKKTGKEKGTKDSIKRTSVVSFYMVYTNVSIIAAPPSITINDDAINKQLGLSTENTGTATAATESRDKPNAPPRFTHSRFSLTTWMHWHWLYRRQSIILFIER